MATRKLPPGVTLEGLIHEAEAAEEAARKALGDARDAWKRAAEYMPGSVSGAARSHSERAHAALLRLGQSKPEGGDDDAEEGDW